MRQAGQINPPVGELRGDGQEFARQRTAGNQRQAGLRHRRHAAFSRQ